MKNYKKFAAIFLAVAVALTSTSVLAFAAEVEDEQMGGESVEMTLNGQDGENTENKVPKTASEASASAVLADDNGASLKVAVSWENLSTEEGYYYRYAKSTDDITAAEATKVDAETSSAEISLDRNAEYKIQVAPAAAVPETDPVEYAADWEKKVETTFKYEAPEKVPYVELHPSYNSVILRWTPVECDKYIVLRSTDSEFAQDATTEYALTGSDVTIVTLPSDVEGEEGEKLVQWDNGGLTKNANYYYRIYAVTEKAGETYKAEPAEVYGKSVRQIYQKITFKETKTLTAHDSGKKCSKKFKKGTVVTAENFGGGKYKFYYTVNGEKRYFYVSHIRTKNAKADYINSLTNNYDEVTAESFVNKCGATSGTKYLIWVSTYTQHMYIFEGSKGNWELIKDWEVSSGKAASPSPTGFGKQIQKHIKRRSGIQYWCTFQSYNSIHGKKSSYKIDGAPHSHGCVRNTNDHAKWIYSNCKNKTGVIIF